MAVLLESVCSSYTPGAGSISVSLRSPYGALARAAESGDWLGVLVEYRTAVLAQTVNVSPCSTLSVATIDLHSPEGWSKITSVSELRMKTVGQRKIESSNVWSAVQQLTDTAERIRGTRALVPRGVQRFTTFEEAHEWMLEMIASTHASQGRKISLKSAPL